jgi:hypothetical protein
MLAFQIALILSETINMVETMIWATTNFLIKTTNPFMVGFFKSRSGSHKVLWVGSEKILIQKTKKL